MVRLYEIVQNDVVTNAGSFIGFKLDKTTIDNMRFFLKSLSVGNQIDPSDYHVTLISSPTKIDWDCASYKDDPIEISPDDMFWWVFDGKDGKKCLVLRFDHKRLQERFKDALEMGGKSDFPKYLPHFTVSYDSEYSQTSILRIPLPSFSIILVKEYIEDNK